MKKKIILFLTAFILSFSLMGCGKSISYQEAMNPTVEKKTVGNGYFTLIAEWKDSYNRYQIVYANDSYVKYLICVNLTPQQGGYGITPLYNADGTLQIYEVDIE